MPARWVVADTVYGPARGLRGWLEEQGCSYVLAVPGTHGVYLRPAALELIEQELGEDVVVAIPLPFLAQRD